MSESLLLLTEAEKLAKVADAIGRSYATELSRVLRDLERELRTIAVDAVDGSLTALTRAVRAARLRKELQRALTEAGYAQLTETATSAPLDALLLQVERLRGAAKLAAFGARDHARILALKELARIDLLGQGDEIAHALWRTLAQGLFSQRRVVDLLADLSDAVDVEEARLRTLYDTTVSIFGRQVEAMKASGDGDEPFVYVGPMDRKTRPFCFERIGKVYTRAAIDKWDNGQLSGSPFLVCGGYNCRHTLQAVSRLSEIRDLADRNERIPEVAAHIAELERGGRKAA